MLRSLYLPPMQSNAWKHGFCGSAPLLISMGGLNAILRQLDPLLSTKQRQQDEHPLMRALAGVQAEMIGERTLQDLHAIADLELLAPGQLDSTAALTGSKLVDDVIAQLRWPVAGHNHCGDPNTPTCVPPPPILEGDKTIRWKQRPKSLNSASAFGRPFTNPRDINAELGKLEEAPRRLLTRRLSARNDPAHPRQPRIERLRA